MQYKNFDSSKWIFHVRFFISAHHSNLNSKTGRIRSKTAWRSERRAYVIGTRTRPSLSSARSALSSSLSLSPRSILTDRGNFTFPIDDVSSLAARWLSLIDALLVLRTLNMHGTMGFEPPSSANAPIEWPSPSLLPRSLVKYQRVRCSKHPNTSKLKAYPI